MPDRIELLSVSLLDSERERINELKHLARRLKLEFGWHYLLDISWILSLIDQISNRKIIDAGAGTGVIQWYLAENGAEVISVDRESREYIAAKFRRRFDVEGLRPEDLNSDSAVSGSAGISLKSVAADWVDQFRMSSGNYSNGKNSAAGKSRETFR